MPSNIIHKEYSVIGTPLTGNSFPLKFDYAIQTGIKEYTDMNWECVNDETQIEYIIDTDTNQQGILVGDTLFPISNWNNDEQAYFIKTINTVLYLRLWKIFDIDPNSHNVIHARIKQSHLPLTVNLQRVDFKSIGYDSYFQWSPELRGILMWDDEKQCISIHIPENLEPMEYFNGISRKYSLYLHDSRLFGIRINSIEADKKETLAYIKSYQDQNDIIEIGEDLEIGDEIGDEIGEDIGDLFDNLIICD